LISLIHVVHRIDVGVRSFFKNVYLTEKN
jgi:hypothetical protein